MEDSKTEKFSESRQVRLAAAILAALFVLLAGAYYFFVQLSFVPLYEDLRPGQASEVAAELEHREIAFRVEDNGRTILVSSGSADALRLSIDGARAPASQLTGFELFNDSDMGLTDFAQRIKFQRALQGELARTIVSIDGIEDARVHISIPERALFRGEEASPKAAVSISTDIKDVPSRSRIVGIQRLVSASVPGLEPASVVVLNDIGEIISAHDDTLYSDTVRDVDEAVQQSRYLKARAERAIESAFIGLDFEVVASVLPRSDQQGIADAKETAPKFVNKIIVVTDNLLTDVEQTTIRGAISEVLNLEPDLGEGVEFRVRLVQAGNLIAGIDGGSGELANEEPGLLGMGQKQLLPFPISTSTILAAVGGGILCVSLILMFAFRYFRKRRIRKRENMQFADNLKLQLALLENN